MSDSHAAYTVLRTYLLDKTDFSEENLATIFSYFRLKKAARYEFLLTSGEVCRHLYFVSRGSFRLFYTQPDGAEATRYFALENTFGTALQSFLTQEPSLETNQVLENSDLLFISYEDFYHLHATLPGWDAVYRYILETAYIISTRRFETFLCLDAADRYRWLLRMHPSLIERFSNKHVASYLGLSQETLSRLKSRIGRSPQPT
ncbi:Crp/Fnr family transcriptional regulator [Siphonobacter curvatus]|uniref:Crp/Fnr family transcriptional regulator n=1 Tax=Siphonobacter curvatus TaxID=2094562 RepID=A0A2S7ISK4_9BACT|nr:Crp/Fnr family transcriptional regulator [Siphonobacter curvatus]PQA60707.1 Crp/Fnr family transcriptional regulator [Siphonobacter curvatus]